MPAPARNRSTGRQLDLVAGIAVLTAGRWLTTSDLCILDWESHLVMVDAERKKVDRSTMDEIGEVEGLGPAMRALNERRRRFVAILLQQVRPNYLRAADMAGFAPAGSDTAPKKRRAVLKQIGWRLAHDERVIAAINEEVSKRFRSAGALIGLEVMTRIALNDKHKDQLRAAEMLASRAGFGAEQRIKVDHTHTDRTGAEMVARIRELATKHGLDPAIFLGNSASKLNAPLIEATASPIRE
jgi:hypothetical protein